MGTLWISITQVKVPYVFYGEHRTTLCAMWRNQSSSPERGKCHGFFQAAERTWGIYLSYGEDGPSKLMFVQLPQDSCLVTKDTSSISWRLGSEIGTILEVRRETHGPFPVATRIWGLDSIFNGSHGSSPFEALNSVCLSLCQRDMSPPVEMRRGPRAISRVSTGDSDIPSSCEMKCEPVFKPLQGNLAFF